MGYGLFSKNDKLWSLSDAFSEIKSDFSYGDWKDKTSSIAKFVGKTVANSGMLAADTAIEAVKHAVNNKEEIEGKLASQASRSSHESGTKMPDDLKQELEQKVRAGERAQKFRIKKEEIEQKVSERIGRLKEELENKVISEEVYGECIEKEYQEYERQVNYWREVYS